MMGVVSEPRAVVSEQVDPLSAVRKRAEAFTAEVLTAAMGHPVQMANGGLYVRGLLEQGERKSLEPLVQRLGDQAEYQSMQQFLADSPWEPALVVKAVAERVAGEIDVEAWVLDDTGFRRTGSTRLVSSVSTPGRWERSATVRSGCRCTRSVAAGRCRWGGRCICPKSGATTPSGIVTRFV
jgi:DDE superfamily endonuclease